MTQQNKELADPVQNFMEEMCLVRPSAQCDKRQLWRWFVRWAETKESFPIMNEMMLSKRIKKLCPAVQFGRKVINGIGLLPRAMSELAGETTSPFPPRSLREQEFSYFAGIVEEHIAHYTIPQYGDAPGDELESWTAGQCVKAISKYTARFESGRRGQLETLRDLVKIAHFAAVAFSKLGASGDDIRKIRAGKV